MTPDSEPVPDSRFVTVDGVELHYTEWGDPDAPPVVCAHGLSRNSRDFDAFCRLLADDYRLLCPDMPGRGRSEWIPADGDPDDWYTAARMAGLCEGFCDELGLGGVRWVGTSMGGTLGMALAAGSMRDRIERLVLNDVGPAPGEDEAADEGIDRIVDYLTDPPAFDRLSELEAHYRDVYDTFSELTDREWRDLTVHSARRRDDGRWTPNYDPRVVAPLLTAEPAMDPWEMWEAIEAPTFVLRGVDSDILAERTFEEMRERREVESKVVDCGHAPMLNVPEQVDPVRTFLE
jgi:pimeloyl-ACP methyl ester carboxylesterase